MPGHREVNASPRVNPMDVLFSRLVRFLDANGVEIAALDDAAARTAGELLGARDASDVVDASVVVLAHHHDAAVVTSDADDIRRPSGSLRVIAC